MSHVKAEIASQPDCWRQATGQGLDPDHPRNLTRSVVLR
jgi:hypothetical protein